jgi:hypothetical protein
MNRIDPSQRKSPAVVAGASLALWAALIWLVAELV